jgi:hypothetical protein
MNASHALMSILFILLHQVASSGSWLGYVKTTGDVWSIYRQSEGKGFNDRDLSRNNLDFMGTDLLNKREPSKNLIVEMSLDRMNASVFAADKGILRAERKATIDLNFKLSTHATGIADMSYQQPGPKSDSKSQRGYDALNGGYERYSGSFSLTKDIRMKSKFDVGD